MMMRICCSYKRCNKHDRHEKNIAQWPDQSEAVIESLKKTALRKSQSSQALSERMVNLESGHSKTTSDWQPRAQSGNMVLRHRSTSRFRQIAITYHDRNRLTIGQPLHSMLPFSPTAGFAATESTVQARYPSGHRVLPAPSAPPECDPGPAIHIAPPPEYAPDCVTVL